MAVSDKAGHYQFTGIPEGSYALAASLAGYQTAVRKGARVKSVSTTRLPFRFKASYRRVLELAKGSRDNDPDGYRVEFIKLVEAAGQLAVKHD